jgi:hypothetical protein
LLEVWATAARLWKIHLSFMHSGCKWRFKLTTMPMAPDRQSGATEICQRRRSGTFFALRDLSHLERQR